MPPLKTLLTSFVIDSGQTFFWLRAGVTPGEADLAAYTRSIERLNTSLGFLQTEMQRLAQQQEKIMAMREQQQQTWTIPPPAPSPHRYHLKSWILLENTDELKK